MCKLILNQMYPHAESVLFIAVYIPSIFPFISVFFLLPLSFNSVFGKK